MDNAKDLFPNIPNRLRVIDDDAAAVAKARQAEASFPATCKRLWSWGIPAKDVARIVTGHDLDVHTPPMRSATELSKGRCGVVILSGGLGCGKTVAAGWWLRHAEASHPPFVSAGPRRFISAPWLARQGRYRDTPLDELERAGLLVLDDLGMEFADARGNFFADLDALMDARYRNCLGTMITTNMSKDQFRKRYGGAGDDRGRLLDRIRETGQFFNVDGLNLRHPAQRQQKGSA